MKIGILGATHLARTMWNACEIRGLYVETNPERCDLVIVARDVEDHRRLADVDTIMSWACDLPERVPVVLMSQVPPGYTRKWGERRRNVFYQLDPIIMNNALRRAALPERIVLGAHEKRSVPDVLGRYLEAFDCPICYMTYEEAELSKLAVNYLLSKQIEAVNDLHRVAWKLGAMWENMIEGLRLDGRLGAYLRPGEPGGHLPRDVRTIERLLEEAECLTAPSASERKLTTPSA